ncbi:MAG: hypothetical protein J3K34DRAFT_521384 [Monoraphidium minutum]|nr:MAG: hypothetical protein J3K34DRAFT_521384 [Monoraphidium minutum]
MRTRRIAISVRQWNSEEGERTWKFCKQHVLQPKDGTPWNDQLTLVHVPVGRPPKGDGKGGAGKGDKEREREAWDSGGPTIPDVATAVQPYNCAIQELEARGPTQGDPSIALVDYVNKEGMDILVLASRGRGAVKKAVMGSITEAVMARAACACLVVKPQVGAGDTYRIKSVASASGASASVPPAGGPPGASSPAGGPPAPRSPAASPIYGSRGSGQGAGLATPFNRRVAIAYDTTASGRYLLKWAAENILEPADNIFVVRAVPKMRRPGTSFADKNSVQRLAGDALSGLPHITTFNLPQQGNARKAVLDFAGKEGVDMLVIGMYKGSCKRKGLARRGNATVIYNRCACPVMVVPMSEAALVVAVKAAELEAAAQEEAELASGSESDSDDGDDDADGEVGHAGGLIGRPYPRALKGAITTMGAFAENVFGAGKRRFSGAAGAGAAGGDGGPASPLASGDGRGGHRGGHGLAGAGLAAGRYVIEVDGAGGIKSINPLPGGGDGAEGGEPALGGGSGGGGERARRSSAGSADLGKGEGGGGPQLALLRQAKEIADLRAQLEALRGAGAGAPAPEAAAAGGKGEDGGAGEAPAAGGA